MSYYLFIILCDFHSSGENVVLNTIGPRRQSFQSCLTAHCRLGGDSVT